MEEPILNSHNKAEYEPAHTAEHILNRTMVNMFGCPRSRNAHIERKKSKCDYLLAECPTDDQVKAIEAKVNEVIAAALPVSIEYMSREEAVLSKSSRQLTGYASVMKSAKFQKRFCYLIQVPRRQSSSNGPRLWLFSHHVQNQYCRAMKAAPISQLAVCPQTRKSPKPQL